MTKSVETTMHMQPVDLAKAHRLLNHGPTVLVSARHDAVTDVMAAAWACVLDLNPAKVTVVLDKQARTRELAEASGRFVLQVPVVDQLAMVDTLGTTTLHENPEKLAKSGVKLFDVPCHTGPFVTGCAAWLSCRIIPEPRNQSTYDLFIAEVEAAWADDRIFRNGHWLFEAASPGWRTIHHVSGGHYLAIGESVSTNREVLAAIGSA